MKKSFLIFTLCSVFFASNLFAQDAEMNDSVFLQLNSELEPYQQLISYASEVYSVAASEKKGIGRYSCDKIYSTEGYSVVPEYLCELIVHSNKGPIVVKYKELLPETDQQIRDFIKENHLDKNLYYNNGRFRFSLEEETDEQQTDTSDESSTESASAAETKRAPKAQTNPAGKQRGPRGRDVAARARERGSRRPQ